MATNQYDTKRNNHKLFQMKHDISCFHSTKKMTVLAFIFLSSQDRKYSSMLPPFLQLCLLLGLFAGPFGQNTDKESIFRSINEVGGCCGPINENCGNCTPKAQMPNLKAGYSCCLPRERKSSVTGPLYWCCMCGYPDYQAYYGEPCCAGYC